MAILRVRKGASPGLVFPVPRTAQPTVVGRDPTATVYVEDARASRRNARLRLAVGQWYIEDLGSSNGTYVNAQRVQKARIKGGTHIQVGKTLLLFEEAPLASFTGLDIQGTQVQESLAEASGVFVFKGYQSALQREVRVDWALPARSIPEACRQRLQQACGEAFELQDLGILPVVQAEAGVDGSQPFLIIKGHPAPSLADKLSAVLELPLAARVQIFRQIVEAVLERSSWENLRSPVGLAHVSVAWNQEGVPLVQVPPLELRAFVAEQTGDLVHLPEHAPYLPPEYQRGPPGAAAPPLASSMYNLGAMGYHLLTGQRPAGDGSVGSMLQNHRSLKQAPANLVSPEVPRSLADTLDRMLEKDPARRPPGRAEIIEAIAAALSEIDDGHHREEPATVLRAGAAARPDPQTPPAQQTQHPQTQHPQTQVPRTPPAQAQPASAPVRQPARPRRRRVSILHQLAYLPLWLLFWAALFLTVRFVSRVVLSALEQQP